MKLDITTTRIMVTGGAAPIAGAVAAHLAGAGCPEIVRVSPAEFALARQAGVTRALAAVEPQAVVHLDIALQPGASLHERAVAALELIEQSARAGVARCVCVLPEPAGADVVGTALAGLLLARLGQAADGSRDALVLVGEGAATGAVGAAIVDALTGDVADVPIRVPAAPGAGRGPDQGARTGEGPEHADSSFLQSPVEQIADGDQVIAVILRGSLATPGVSFYSQDHFSQQLGFIHHPAGHVIPPHVHNPVAREVTYTQETLFIREGRVRVDLYRDDRTLLTRRVLATGDVILLCTGGHGFEILEESSIVEVKQGPYAGDGDKTRFEAAE